MAFSPFCAAMSPNIDMSMSLVTFVFVPVRTTWPCSAVSLRDELLEVVQEPVAPAHEQSPASDDSLPTAAVSAFQPPALLMVPT